MATWIQTSSYKNSFLDNCKRLFYFREKIYPKRHFWFTLFLMVKMQKNDWFKTVNISHILDCYQWHVKHKKARQDIQNIWVYTKLKHTCVNHTVNQHLIVLNLHSVSINKFLVTEFIALKVSQNLNLVLHVNTVKSTTYKSVFSNVIEYLGQNIQKRINCKKRPFSTKQMNRV